MKRYWMVLAAILVVGLAAGMALAATNAGGAKPGEKAGPAKAPRGDQQAPGQGNGPPPPPDGVRPPLPPPLVDAIEAKLGKALTEKQKAAIEEAAKAQFQALDAGRETFIAAVSEITGLAAEKVEALMPKHGPPPPPPDAQKSGTHQGKAPPPSGDQKSKRPGGTQASSDGPPPPPPPPPGGKRLKDAIEKELGTKLTEDQLAQLRAAGDAMRDASKAAHDAFDARVAEITGLSVDDIRAMKPAPHGPGGPPPDGGKQGPPPGQDAGK